MKISKQDALMWFSFFAALPEDEEIMPRQMEIVYAVFAQLEDAVEAGLPEVAELMENGLEYVAGTDLKCVPEAVRERIENAKLLIGRREAAALGTMTARRGRIIQPEIVTVSFIEGTSFRLTL